MYKRVVLVMRVGWTLTQRTAGAPLSDSSASVRRTVLLEDIEGQRQPRAGPGAAAEAAPVLVSVALRRRGPDLVAARPLRRPAVATGRRPRPARPSSTWDRVTKRRARGPRPGRRGAAVRRRRSTTTTIVLAISLDPSGFMNTTTRRVVPSTKPPGTPRRSSRRTTCRLLGISCSAPSPYI